MARNQKTRLLLSVIISLSIIAYMLYNTYNDEMNKLKSNLFTFIGGVGIDVFILSRVDNNNINNGSQIDDLISTSVGGVIFNIAQTFNQLSQQVNTIQRSRINLISPFGNDWISKSIRNECIQSGFDIPINITIQGSTPLCVCRMNPNGQLSNIICDFSLVRGQLKISHFEQQQISNNSDSNKKNKNKNSKQKSFSDIISNSQFVVLDGNYLPDVTQMIIRLSRKMNIPIIYVPTSWQGYEQSLKSALDLNIDSLNQNESSIYHQNRNIVNVPTIIHLNQYELQTASNQINIQRKKQKQNESQQQTNIDENHQYKQEDDDEEQFWNNIHNESLLLLNGGVEVIVTTAGKRGIGICARSRKGIIKKQEKSNNQTQSIIQNELNSSINNNNSNENQKSQILHQQNKYDEQKEIQQENIKNEQENIDIHFNSKQVSFEPNITESYSFITEIQSQSTKSQQKQSKEQQISQVQSKENQSDKNEQNSSSQQVNIQNTNISLHLTGNSDNTLQDDNEYEHIPHIFIYKSALDANITNNVGAGDSACASMLVQLIENEILKKPTYQQTQIQKNPHQLKQSINKTSLANNNNTQSKIQHEKNDKQIKQNKIDQSNNKTKLIAINESIQIHKHYQGHQSHQHRIVKKNKKESIITKVFKTTGNYSNNNKIIKNNTSNLKKSRINQKNSSILSKTPTIKKKTTQQYQYQQKYLLSDIYYSMSENNQKVLWESVIDSELAAAKAQIERPIKSMSFNNKQTTQ